MKTKKAIENKSVNLEMTHRLADFDDVPDIIELMQASIEINMSAFLSNEEIKAAQETMGVDSTLLEDKTYYIIETISSGVAVMIGCGGWGKRRTLYGGDHTVGRDDCLSDPNQDAARIRAMYTHPNWTRSGVGAYLLKLGEKAARNAGFKTIELGSTIAGEPLYKKCGYIEVSRELHITENGAQSLIIKMVKKL